MDSRNRVLEDIDKSFTPSIMFSIVIPAYNVEAYLNEAVQSVVEQTIGFKDNVEIIIINDGSTDATGAVADGLKHRYPQNIHVYHQENHGVSVTRNRGMKLAVGKYVGFLDPDDRYSEDTFENVAAFFEQHQSEIDVVGIPIEFFEAKRGSHILNNKFAGGTRVIDVRKDWHFHQGSIASAFVKNEAIDAYAVSLDPRLKYAEDMKFMTQIIMKRKKFGVVKEACYCYRKRAQGGSALDTNLDHKEYYSDVLKYFGEELFNQFREPNGTVPKYVQYLVCYDLQWRIMQRQQKVLLDVEVEEYKRRLAGLARDLDVDVILKQRNIYIDHKLFLLGLRRGKPALPDLQVKWHSVYLDDEKVWGAPAKAFSCVLQSVREVEGRLRFKGNFRGLPIEAFEFGFIANDTFIKAKRIPSPMKRRTVFLGEEIFHPFYFEVELPISVGDRIRPCVRYGGHIYYSRFIYRRNSGLLPLENSYKVLDSCILQNVNSKYLATLEPNPKNIFHRELSFLKRLIKNRNIVGIERKKTTLIWFRLLSHLVRTFKRKPVWLISDRFSSAGDNGEALFRYLSGKSDGSRAVYFLQSRGTDEFGELRGIGRVVDPESFRGRLLYLVADVFASSQADDYVLNPFGKDARVMQDRYQYDFVFLQHGVTLHDISDWLNVLEKPISKFIVCGEMERHALTSGRYMLSSDEVAVTGFPRHDRLVDCRTSRKIVIAPTWRADLAGSFDVETKTRCYRDDFKDSQYFMFFQAVLNDPKLHEALTKFEFDLDFVLHPNFAVQSSDFTADGRIRIVKPPYDYKKLISEATVFVTDYSSVVADAAYLRKQICYIQFDRILDAGNHTVTRGEFDYERDGFGPVLKTVDELVSYLVSSMQCPLRTNERYLSRRDRVFSFSDHDNSARVEAHMRKIS